MNLLFSYGFKIITMAIFVADTLSFCLPKCINKFWTCQYKNNHKPVRLPFKIRIAQIVFDITDYAGYIWFLLSKKPVVRTMANQNEELEKVRCALCGGDDTELLHSAPPWGYVKCRKCGLIYVNPRSKENAVQKVYEKNKLMSWFKNKTYDYRKMGDLKNIEGRLRRGEEIMYEVARYKDGGRLLDIGCNRGFILANAAAWGWEAHGIEIVPWATKLVEREFDVKIYNCRLQEVDPPFEDGYFDAITMMDVVEHFHEPVKDLSEVRRILKDDGFLLLNTPDIGSAYAKIGGYERMFRVPEQHLYLYDRKTLKAMLDKTGFEIVTIQKSKASLEEMEVHVRKKK